MKAADVFRALKQHHSNGNGHYWAFFGELRNGTGWFSDRQMDAWAMSLWPSTHFEKIAYEIKVDRRDWKRELANPRKRQSALSLSNKFYFVTPAHLVDPEEVPVEAGLLEVTSNLQVVEKVKAPWRPCDQLPIGFIAALLRVATVRVARTV